MIRKLICLACFFCLYSSGFAQLRIEDCYRKSKENYPLIKQHALIEKTKEYNLSNANKGYLPQLNFSAKASYQSEVTKLPIDLSRLGLQGNIPSLKKDQYGATLDISQVLWDGGAIKTQKKTLRTTAEVEHKQLEASMYAINERINHLYFGILLTHAQKRQNQLLQEELQRNYDKVQTYVNHGLANEADLHAVKVELLKVKQTEVQIATTQESYMSILSKFIGEDVNTRTELVKPELLQEQDREIKRPELALFEAQKRNLETQKQQIKTGLMPKISLFATGGYGRPGLNMLESKFSAYYMGGIRLSWNIGNFYTQKNSLKKIETSLGQIESQKEAFLLNTQMDIDNKKSLIKRYAEQLKYDDEIILLRQSVKEASINKMANGTLSGVDLARDINAEQMAKQDKILHEMEMLLAVYNLKYVTN